MGLFYDTVKNNIKKSLVDHGMKADDHCIDLLVMIASHESGLFKYARQNAVITSSTSLAMGMFQMERDTAIDVCEYIKKKHSKFNTYVVFKANQMLDGVISDLYLIFNFQLSVILARAFLMRIPDPIPEDNALMADYPKKYWNTSLGKATKKDYLDAFIYIKNC